MGSFKRGVKKQHAGRQGEDGCRLSIATDPTKYFGCELGAQTQFDFKNERFIVNGSHDSAKLQDLLDGFIRKFVLCPECDNPETDLIVSTKRNTISQGCKACGYHGQLEFNHKLNTFILKNPPANDPAVQPDPLSGTRNLVEFNAKKTQACAFTAKTSSFLPLPSLQGTTLPLQSNISMLGMEVRSDLNPKNYIETVIKTASRKLGVLNKVRRFFTPDQLCLLYKTQVRSCVEYCSHLWDGSAKYLLDALDRLQRRAIRIIGDEEVTKHLEPLQLRRDVASLSAFYRLYHGECSEELFSLIPPSPFLQRTTRAGLRCHRLTVATIPTRTKKFGDSFLCRTIRKWNALPAHVFPPSYNLGSFKRGVKKQHAGRQGEDGWCGR
ncbi:hypothetical protein evm_010048 [Chilo suppressalis]|nr:hypothetical protein evm_010048 [Chilo suppressalis]